MSRRIREGEEELEKLRKEGEQLQTSLPEVADHIWGGGGTRRLFHAPLKTLYTARGKKRAVGSEAKTYLVCISVWIPLFGLCSPVYTHESSLTTSTSVAEGLDYLSRILIASIPCSA